MTKSLIFSELDYQRSAVLKVIQATGLFESNSEAATEREAFYNIKSSDISAVFCTDKHSFKRGFRWIRWREKIPSLSSIPVFVFTEKDDAQGRIQAYELGADDCLNFDISVDEALVRIRRQIHLRCNIAELQRAKTDLIKQAWTDPLTGLGNRRSFNCALDTEISRLRRKAEPFSLLILDLDHFKKINDTFGHQVGDSILKHVANILLSCLRKFDTVCRLGGEEFAVIIPGAHVEDARKVAERIRSRVASDRAVDNPDVKIHISIGIRCLDYPKNPEEVIEEADRALYEAKNLGRNRVEVHSDWSRETPRMSKRTKGHILDSAGCVM